VGQFDQGRVDPSGTEALPYLVICTRLLPTQWSIWNLGTGLFDPEWPILIFAVAHFANGPGISTEFSGVDI
jgi:hypothetical protein